MTEIVGPDMSPARHVWRHWRDPDAFHYQLRSDSAYMAELTYCWERGLPPSIFRGRPMPEPGESYWSDDDRLEILAFATWRAQVCPGCGMHPLDWPNETGPSRKPMKVRTVKCFSCAELHESQAAIPEGHRRQVRTYLVPTGPPPERA